MEVHRFDDPMNGTTLSFLISKYGTDYFYVIDLSGDQEINAFLFAGIDQPSTLHIFSIALDIEYENQGWGTKLMQYLITEATKNHIKIIKLHVEVGNKKAINLYTKLRFREVDISSNYYGTDRDGILMELEL